MQTSISETISYLIAQVCKAHRNKANDLLAQIDLHAGQEFFLLNLWEQDGITQSEMAEGLCIQPATVTKMLDRMEKSGLVERRRDTADQRVSRVYLTKGGRSMRQPIEQVWQELESLSTAHFTTEERLLLRRLLLQISQNLNQ